MSIASDIIGTHYRYPDYYLVGREKIREYAKAIQSGDPLHYSEELFNERQLRSVTANTRADGEEFLRIAAEIPLRPTTMAYPFEAADQALRDLAEDRITGAAVLHMEHT